MAHHVSFVQAKKKKKNMFIRTQSMYTPKQHVNDQNNAKTVFQI